MELKDYQADVLAHLSNYLETLLECKGHLSNAFTTFNPAWVPEFSA